LGKEERERKNTVLAEKRAKVCDNGKVREGEEGRESLLRIVRF
jgi:hypothetical protein